MSEFAQTLTPVVTTITPYSAGQALGALMTFSKLLPLPNRFSATIETLLIRDGSKQASAMDLFLLSGIPSVANNNGATFDLSGADLALYVGHISIVTGDYSLCNSTACACLTNLGNVVRLPTNNLYAQLVCRGTPTYTHLNDISVTILATAHR
jgi:hypothetical protein